MDDALQKITLIIEGKAFSFPVKRSEEIYYRRAAENIKKTIEFYKKKFSEDDEKDIWRLGLLQLAVNLEMEKAKQDTQPYIDKLTALMDDVSKCIDENE